jgi:AraC-like DNA-binding protein
MIYPSAPFDNYVALARALAQKLKIPFDDNRLEIPPHLGQGYLYAADLNEDISFCLSDISVKEDLGFQQTAVSDKTHFSIQFYKSEVSVSYNDRTGLWVVSKGISDGRIALLIKADALQRLIREDSLVAVRTYADLGVTIDYSRLIHFEWQSLMDRVFSVNGKTEFGRLVIRSTVVLLLEMFFHLSIPNEPGKRVKKEDMEKLLTVERMLAGRDIDRFPSIARLAKIAMMSASKLKMKFKEAYGMRLYEYYNRCRLRKAREILTQGKATVKEVAYTIGYSNVSNFSAAFKREFGFLPGKFRKSQDVRPL